MFRSFLYFLAKILGDTPATFHITSKNHTLLENNEKILCSNGKAKSLNEFLNESEDPETEVTELVNGHWVTRKE